MKMAIGLIAGNGKLPLMVASGIRARGSRVVAIGHHGATRKDLRTKADTLHWVHVGELGKTIEILKGEGIRQVVFIGGIPKTLFFSQTRPDQRAIQVLSRLRDRKDDAILRAIAEEMEGEGMEVVSPVPFLKEAAAPKGCWTQRRPTESEERDIAFGWALAKKVGRLDIGQCLVVKDQMVLAVEAIEGTDETIRRGARLGRGKVTVVKICKPGQDRRLDLPVIGPRTVRNLKKFGATSLVVEARKTIVVDKEEVIRMADEGGICLVGR